MMRAELLEFFRRHRLAVVSTISSDGAPEAAVVGIAATPELEIIFDTVKTSRKYRNLMANPAAAVTVWSGEKTTQYEGVAFEPDGAELDRYREIYFATFPDGRDRLSWAGITHLVIRPKWVRYSDFDARPPRIEELRF